ncbi:hypothetical protein [Burkholderia ubonensis]|uniref:hypothetical protein n=1 Tax=Burkholderia ubonensis TaxID=101571 RepID=UPI00075A25C5|nr:hypothetical protein [Burkholderia ubonensis]KVD76027.1 hypothetical protein WI89_07840 [Burkholderia ubonensis]KVT09812.1 hypothetical protein WK47_07135 [Burkholderia ubonensis]KVT15133.1 hypothetical protein WK46_26335 [Burkholderia ubonensis]KVT35738.1 hypothetical protein WK50_31240 [Burkholderia ubonensis]KWB50400.1 hypothetical protein WL36_05695 [Burkholderia ubonensis]
MGLFNKGAKPSAADTSTEAKKPSGTFFDSGTADGKPGARKDEQAPGIGAATDHAINIDESLTLQTEITETSRDYLAKSVQATDDTKAQPSFRQRIEHSTRPRSMPAEPDGLFYLSTHRAMRGELAMPESERAKLKEVQEQRALRGLFVLLDLFSR